MTWDWGLTIAGACVTLFGFGLGYWLGYTGRDRKWR